MVSDPYEVIGAGHGDRRRPDPRIVQMIDQAHVGRAMERLAPGTGLRLCAPVASLTH